MVAWSKMRHIVIDICIALASLRLPPYIVLWIIDQIPPMSHRFTYKDNDDYDPHHLRKLRLIEGVERAVERIVSQRV